MIHALGVPDTVASVTRRSCCGEPGRHVGPAALAVLVALAGLVVRAIPGSVPAALAQSDFAIRGTSAATAPVVIVNGSSSSCSDAGPGTSTSPYCTISAAILAHHDPGTTDRKSTRLNSSHTDIS